MEDDVRKALDYFGTTLSRAGRGLPDIEEARVILKKLLMNMHEDRLRPNSAQAWQQRMRAKGGCRACGEPIWRPGAAFCRLHLDMALAASRARRQAKRA